MVKKVSNTIKNMKVRKKDLIDARKIYFGIKLYDWEIFKCLCDFCNDNKRVFIQWRKNIPQKKLTKMI